MEIVHRDETCTIGFHGPVMFTYWRRAPSLAAFDRLAAAQSPWFARMGADLGAVTILDANVSLMIGAAERERAADLQRRAKSHVAAIATVVNMEGFAGAMVRGVLTSVSLLSGLRASERVFRVAPEAGQWLASTLAARGRTVPAADIERGLDFVQRGR